MYIEVDGLDCVGRQVYDGMCGSSVGSTVRGLYSLSRDNHWGGMFVIRMVY